MRPVSRGSILALLVLFMVSASARSDSKAGSNYVLGPDDVIEITVLNHQGLDKTVNVLPDGTITYPWAGQIKAVGKTPKQLAAQIKSELEKTRNNVEVTVAVKEVHSRLVRVVGAVKAPNAYNLKPNWRVLDLVAVAGGLTARSARVTGRIIRDGEIIPIDLAEDSTRTSDASNPLLRPDDLVFLEERDPSQNKAYVMGQVRRPGAYDLGDEGINILSLLSQAGDTTETAALTKAYILRGTTQIPINLRPVLAEGKLDESVRNLTLQAGDVLFIPAIERRVAVMGQVNKPGYYPLPETRELNVLDMLSLAGGQTPTGDLGKAGIIRMVDGAAKVFPVDIEKMLQKGNLTANVSLQPDDVLFIPARGERRFEWRDILGPLSILSFFGVGR
jgi:protein involved in polysaccharide export with SLBB domain